MTQNELKKMMLESGMFRFNGESAWRGGIQDFENLARLVSANAITSMQTNSNLLDAADKANEDLDNGLFDEEINATEPEHSTVTSMQESISEKCTSEPTNQLLENWLNINMPAGTEIGDPKWWAIRIRNVLSLEAVSQKFTNKDADTIGLIASREIMNVLVDAGVILFTSNKPQLQAKIQCAVINAISQDKGESV